MSATKSHLHQRIVDTALTMADRRDWESVRLHAIAAELNISLDDIRHHFREKEDLIDAWFDRADQAMLKLAENEAFREQSSEEKIHALLMGWLDILSTHRRATRQMILGKLEPGHLHYQIKGLLRVSRTVQWLREAAGRDATLPMRAIEETALTALYLATFLHWMFDDSEGRQSTSRFLHRRLESATRCERWWCKGCVKQRTDSVAEKTPGAATGSG